MYFIKYVAFLVLLLHQCVVNCFNMFDIGLGSNYLNRKNNFPNSPLVSEEKITSKNEKTGNGLTERWISQEVDHFNSSDKRKFQMKYYEDLEYWSKDAPIYLHLSVDDTRFWFIDGLMMKLAKETQGAMYRTEHRYYGDSIPFVNLNTENIQYLSSQQALADIAKLIVKLKSLPMYKNSKVVVIGSSYGGNLAAWMKVLYPKLIDAAISSGAPVLAKKDFSEFLNKVKDNYEHYGGTECLNMIKKEIESYDLLLQSPEGIKKLKREKNICDECDMTVLENQQFFYLDTAFWYSYSASSPFLIRRTCSMLENNPDHKILSNKYSKFNNFDSELCDSYDLNQRLNEIHLNRNLGSDYKMLYQSCTEFGHFITTTSKDQPFLNIPLEFYIKVCSALFGKNLDEKRVDKGIENTNKLYGGLKPNVTKVVFTNGDRDPLRTISVLKDLSRDALALVIPGEFNSEDFLSDHKNAEAQELVKYLVKKWIEPDEHLN